MRRSSFLLMLLPLADVAATRFQTGFGAKTLDSVALTLAHARSVIETHEGKVR